MSDFKIRLQKYISECGAASRRAAEELIKSGAVTVNGRKAELGDKIDPKFDTITIRGKKLEGRPDKLTIMLHKPRGYVTTTADERDRKCVTDLTADAETRLYPIGRLDKDSEGLLLLTNDGELANLVMHPKGVINKVYRVTVRPKVTDDQIITLSAGVKLDGVMTAPCKIGVINDYDDRTVLQITLTEGKNRQIRRMCESVGLSCIRLKRVEVGGVRLAMLQPGKWRPLTADELKTLKSNAAERPGKPGYGRAGGKRR